MSSEQQGLYREAFEKDSCGFGLIANLDDRPSHWLVETAIASLGRATVASLLNARQFGGQFGNYPLTESQVIAMFNAVYLGGTYQVNPTVQWTRDDVRNYFESLYGA